MRNISCDDGETAPKLTGDNSWESASSAYSSMIQPAKNYLPYIRADKDAEDTTIEWAMSKYDFIVAKYNKTSDVYNPFVTNRTPSGLMFDVITYPVNNDKNIFIIAFTIAIASLFGVGVFLYQKKKHN